MDYSPKKNEHPLLMVKDAFRDEAILEQSKDLLDCSRLELFMPQTQSISFVKGRGFPKKETNGGISII